MPAATVAAAPTTGAGKTMQTFGAASGWLPRPGIRICGGPAAAADAVAVFGEAI